MIRTISISAILMAIAIYVQSTFASTLMVFGVKPDFALLILIYVAVKNGSMEGQITGFISGMVMDFASGTPLGYYVFIYTLTGFLFGIFNGNLFIDYLIAPFTLCLVGTVGKAIFSGGLSLVFRGSIISYSFFEKTIWIEALFNAVVAPVVFLLLKPIRRFIITERNRV